ncbi:hypothetical protein K470DRAFT_212686 [Piedraia hortae CBS 480.64]|uniref:ER lumen protein retaining receptor n=1 Tax=Piedraia hortae CBS 480.64 TaxID=1314780 RepID=A0A6A7C5T2_9PEZI|nr:hypothetical protein K470DRAFT_212686 [Piedraia hortae CBS 480.64]
MAFNMNIFRILGDVSHTASKCILIWAIHNNRSAEGVSLLTQLLYMLVFVTRYLDLFWVPPWWSWWNFVLKLFYIASSGYIVFLMMRVYTRTREREYGWKLAAWSLAGSLATAPVVDLLIRGWTRTTFSEVLWTFSIELESVCVLPQLLLLRQTTVPTVLDSFYLVTLGSYRFFYLLNWLVRGFGDGWFDPISVLFGLVQTALYVDFAWVYWSRQRIKLRGGGVVDSDDLSRSLLVGRFINRGQTGSSGNGDDDLEGQEAGTRNWGARGISVSADDTLPDEQDARMVDPDVFDDDDDDDDDDDTDAPPPPAKDDAVESSAGEWRANVTDPPSARAGSS